METINHEYYVSLEVAKLLKQAGFDWKCIRYYQNDDETLYGPLVEQYKLVETNFNVAPVYMNQYSAPTLEVAQRWLREVKEKHVIAECEEQISEDNPYATLKYFWSVHNSLEWEYDSHDEIYDSYEEALEAGIKNVLELILKKGK